MRTDALQLPPVDIRRRREMHCGFIERREWLPLPWVAEDRSWPEGGRVRQVGLLQLAGAQYATRNPDTGVVTPDTCPGYAARLPIVHEVARAHAAYEKGALNVLHARLSKAAADGIEVLARAINEYQAQERTASAERREMERAQRDANG